MKRQKAIEMVKNKRLTVVSCSRCDFVTWDIVDNYEGKELQKNIESAECGTWNELQLDGKTIGEFSEFGYDAIEKNGIEIYNILKDIQKNDYNPEVDELIRELWNFPEENEAEKEESKKALISFLSDLNAKLSIYYPRNFSNEYTLIIGDTVDEEAEELKPEEWAEKYLFNWEDIATQDYTRVRIS